MDQNTCGAWTAGDPAMQAYHDNEWCKIHHDDRFEFEMLCLEGASVGLSWRTLLHKRAAYKKAFHNFDIAACAAMTEEELASLLTNPQLVRSRNKIFSVRKNARVVQQLQKEFGSFDAYLWHFTGGKQMDGKWKTSDQVPVLTDLSKTISTDLKKRGMSYVGPVITYSFLQAVGIVNDHLLSCPCR